MINGTKAVHVIPITVKIRQHIFDERQHCQMKNCTWHSLLQGNKNYRGNSLSQLLLSGDRRRVGKNEELTTNYVEESHPRTVWTYQG